MRTPEYLSPSSIAKFHESRDEFYLNYLADNRPPRMAQTRPMSIGSSLDAFAKSFLYEKLFGKNHNPKYDLRTLFEAQVEEHNRDWAWEHGEYCFECYRKSGALADLLLELEASVGTPRFELDVKGVINGYREGVTRDMGVVLLGKPDVFYINKHGCHVILDFKVNGWCSRSAISPMPGYVRIRSGSGHYAVSGPHKDCIPMAWHGTVINQATYLEQHNEDWARQLAIYAWLCGCEIGDEFVTAIDQFVCKPTGAKFPEVRVAEHRLRIGKDFQWKVFADAQQIWECTRNGHFFTNLTREESQARCKMLDDQAAALCKPASEEDAMFNQITRER